ncbi:hypothetical protein QUV80_12170 [Paraclostridium benzoelyticum]|nr:hypothetical protein [Paraclostridium benzoelyticum]
MKNNKLEKHCFKFTEKLLYDYKQIENYIDTLEHLKSTIKAGDYQVVRAITYDSDKISPTFKVNNFEADGVIKVVKVVQEIELEIYSQQALKKQLDRAINNLSPIHRDIIHYRYVECLQWLEIVDKIAYDEKTLRTKKNQAIRSISIALFGSKVFKEEDENLFNLLDM